MCRISGLSNKAIQTLDRNFWIEGCSLYLQKDGFLLRNLGAVTMILFVLFLVTPGPDIGEERRNQNQNQQ
jgi:hypothetical protein